jgi:hypothetical protein
MTRRVREYAIHSQSIAAAVISILMTAPCVRAQVNIERLRSNEDGQFITIDASFSVQSGNSDLNDVAGGVRYDRRRGPTYILGRGSVRYGENNGTTFRNSSFAHVRITHDVASRVAVESFVQLERDGFTLLELRSLAGGGVRLKPVASEKATVYYGSIFMVENERLNDARVSVHPSRVSVGRWSNYWAVSLAITEDVRFTTAAYVQSQIDLFEDVRVLQEASVDVRVSEWMTLFSALNYRYDSRPPDGIESHELAVSNGVQVRL